MQNLVANGVEQLALGLVDVHINHNAPLAGESLPIILAPGEVLEFNLDAPAGHG